MPRSLWPQGGIPPPQECDDNDDEVVEGCGLLTHQSCIRGSGLQVCPQASSISHSHPSAQLGCTTVHHHAQ